MNDIRNMDVSKNINEITENNGFEINTQAGVIFEKYINKFSENLDKIHLSISLEALNVIF